MFLLHVFFIEEKQLSNKIPEKKHTDLKKKEKEKKSNWRKNIIILNLILSLLWKEVEFFPLCFALKSILLAWRRKILSEILLSLGTLVLRNKEEGKIE